MTKPATQSLMEAATAVTQMRDALKEAAETIRAEDAASTPVALPEPMTDDTRPQ